MTPWVDEGGEELAYRVDQYCDEVDGSVREMFRESINKNLKDGRKVVVECGDEL
jgi:phosphate uptake regulator